MHTAVVFYDSRVASMLLLVQHVLNTYSSWFLSESRAYDDSSGIVRQHADAISYGATYVRGRSVRTMFGNTVMSCR